MVDLIEVDDVWKRAVASEAIRKLMAERIVTRGYDRRGIVRYHTGHP
jgi:hypothetical protein